MKAMKSLPNAIFDIIFIVLDIHHSLTIWFYPFFMIGLN